jgi:phospholipid-translocating ATPase
MTYHVGVKVFFFVGQKNTIDREINQENYATYTEDGELTKTSGSLLVGDIIKIEPDQRVPADIVILHCNDKNSRVYIKTDQLDGETDLKLRKPLEYTQKMMSKGGLSRQIFRKNLEFVVDKPNEVIYKFDGSMHEIDNRENIIYREPISLENTIWTNCSASNVEIYGLVIYTFKDTKIVIGNKPAHQKITKVEEEVNYLSKMLFWIMVIMSGF